jgi:hypothetical protein
MPRGDARALVVNGGAGAVVAEDGRHGVTLTI